MQNKKCCFTGHRNIKITHALKGRLWETLCRLVEEYNVTDFYAGGAVGFDMLCEKAVLALKKQYPEVRLHLILPCPPQKQSGKWNDGQKRLFADICEKADSCSILSNEYYQGCMKKRNEELVKNADCCVCYYNDEDPRSGTGQTVRMCKKRGIDIINIFSAFE